MAAKDPFSAAERATSSTKASTSSYMGDTAAAEKLRGLLPAGYDLYVLGTQEKVTTHLHAAVLARLHAAEEHQGRRFVVLRQRRVARRGSSHASSSEDQSEASHSRSYSDDTTRNSDIEQLRRGSFTLEASGSAAVAPRSNQINPETESEESTPRESIKEVRGRGDGAFLHAKSTSIAVYCARDLSHLVAIERSATHKFSWISGSKGGVAVQLSVATGSGMSYQQQHKHQHHQQKVRGRKATVTFANCHLEANKPALRRKQLAVLSTRLGQALAAASSSSDRSSPDPDTTADDLASSSDHVVWMGDFNYRIHTLDGESVLKLLVSGHHLELHDRYDSMRDDLAQLPSMAPFQEPQKWPSFYPTYKKIPGRPQVVDYDPHTGDTQWPQRVYRVLYKEPFYKGGQTKARVPGWCDRILYCSRPRKNPNTKKTSSSELLVEQVEHRDNYRAVNHGLCESDHSPVFCTFQWRISN